MGDGNIERLDSGHAPLRERERGADAGANVDGDCQAAQPRKI